MPQRWFKIEFELELPLFWLRIIPHPDFTIKNSEMRPSWYPRLQFVDMKKLMSETTRYQYRWMLYLTWFFHLTLACGREGPGAAEAYEEEEYGFE